jgi:hypothetical protein
MLFTLPTSGGPPHDLRIIDAAQSPVDGGIRKTNIEEVRWLVVSGLSALR